MVLALAHDAPWRARHREVCEAARAQLGGALRWGSALQRLTVPEWTTDGQARCALEAFDYTPLTTGFAVELIRPLGLPTLFVVGDDWSDWYTPRWAVSLWFAARWLGAHDAEVLACLRAALETLPWEVLAALDVVCALGGREAVRAYIAPFLRDCAPPRRPIT